MEKNNDSKNEFGQVLIKLDELKRLHILQLYIGGATTAEIGHVLGVSYKTIERMVPSSSKGKKKAPL